MKDTLEIIMYIIIPIIISVLILYFVLSQVRVFEVWGAGFCADKSDGVYNIEEYKNLTGALEHYSKNIIKCLNHYPKGMIDTTHTIK